MTQLESVAPTTQSRRAHQNKTETNPMTMKAIVYEAYGAPDVLKIQQVPKPSPKPNEVMIRVHATTVSAADWRLRKADPFAARLFNGLFRPKRKILGMEMAGEIVEVGSAVKQFKVGDAVFCGMGTASGTYAAYVCVPETGAIVHKPENITMEEAAAIPFGATASLYFLRDLGEIQPGQKVLINGASGALGVYGVQLAKYFGAEVTGVCSARNVEVVRQIGADHVIDYTKTDFTQGEEQYDIVYDTVGKTTFAAAKRVLKSNGVFLAAAGFLKEYLQMLSTSILGGKRVKSGVSFENKDQMLFLQDLIEQGKIQPVIGRRYPMEQIVEAHAYVEQGHKTGAVVISML